MKKMISRMVSHRSFPYVMAFLMPFIICVVICIGNGVYPFGDNCILHIDMYHQYCPFFTEFLHKLRTGGSLQYSWNLGLGSDFVSLYAYYLASPLNFLIVLCPKHYVIEFMTILVLAKIALCGLTFFLFLKYHFHLIGKDSKLHKNQVIPALVFSTAYALSGFVAAYSWDIMWMDCILLFPLIMVGLEKLVREQKPGLYFVTLALSVFANYYISIMICIFLVFYFILLFFTQKGGKLKAFLRFAWYSLLAGSVSMVLLLPEIAVLSASGSAEDSFPKTLEWYFSVIAELGRAAAVTTSYTGNDHWPNLYAGAFTLVLVWLYVLNRRISWKEKVPRMLMLVFFLVSFADNQLDYIWHGMHFPQALPGRQSFLYIFVLLVMGFATIRKWKGTRRWHIIIAVLAALTLMVLSGYYGDELVTEYMAVVITMLFILVYGILLLLLKIAPKKMRIALREAAFCVAIAELAVNMAVTGLGVTSRVAYTDKQGYYEDLLQQAKEDNGNDGFYRVEDSGRKTKNDDSLYGYRSATIFSSLMNLDVSHLFQSLYMEGGKNFYCYNGASPLPSAMFSVKYMLSSNPVDESPLRTLVGSNNGNYLYRNNYCLPLGYMMSEKAIKGWESSMLDRIGSLNSLAQQLGAKVVALSDSNGYIYDKDGIQLDIVKEIKEVRRGRIKEYVDEVPTAVYTEGRGIWSIPCDIALPCATQNELNLEDAQTLLANGCFAVAEGANMPSTREATDLFVEKKILFMPGKAANAGGVATSGLEQSQNALRMSWSFEEVDDKLHTIMVNIFAKVSEAAERYQVAGNYVAGANIAGFEKVVEAMLGQGIV